MKFLTGWMGLAALCLGMGLGVVRADDSGVRADSKPAFVNIDVAQFEKMRADTNHVVLDVRTKGEFDKGHIPGAILIDVNQSGFEKAVAKLDRSKTYLVHCAAGIRSMKACNSMRGLEFTNLYNLRGGYKAWVADGNKGVK